jgi:glycosyltransferase involved in cell wall biosynthesis
LPQLLKQHPICQVVIVGGDGVSYGSQPKDAPNWRSKLLAENLVDLNRVHFFGKVPYETYQKVLQVSAAHVYLTYPFVLSWSLLEAMASGCLIIGSDTAPVREVIRDGHNGLLVDFFDSAKLSETLITALNKKSGFGACAQNAWRSAQQFSLKQGLNSYQQLIVGDSLGERVKPVPAIEKVDLS